MKTTICYIRHGQTDWNKNLIIQGRQNHPLNDTGRSQAKILGERMFKENNTDWDIVISSPLDRAKETGKIILNEIKLDKEFIVDPDCIERDFGIYDGALITKERYDLIEVDDVEGIETKKEIVDRAKMFIDKVVSLYPGKKILVFTHSHFIKSTFMNYDKSLTYNNSQFYNCMLNYLIIEDNNVSYMYNK